MYKIAFFGEADSSKISNPTSSFRVFPSDFSIRSPILKTPRANPARFFSLSSAVANETPRVKTGLRIRKPDWSPVS